MRGLLLAVSVLARPAPTGWWKHTAAAAAAVTIAVLAVNAAVRFDPWAGDGCPAAVIKGADCSRLGISGRTYSDVALLNVDRELDHSQWSSAKADLEPILFVRPNFEVALSARGEAEAGLGETTAALADYGRALTLAPDDLTTRAKRGQLYQSLGQTGPAAADFALIYQADKSAPHRDQMVAFVRGIDHSTAPPAVHKHSKRRHTPKVDASPAPEQPTQSEPAAPLPEPPPQAEPSGAN
jgi:hypothetical protein